MRSMGCGSASTSMYRDIAEIRQFYHSALGAQTKTHLLKCLYEFWPDFDSAEAPVIGVGYAIPYLNEKGTSIAVMSATQGGVRWPAHGPNRTVVTEDHLLPFAENSVSRLLLIHAVENADYLRELMSDAWRALSPNGRLLIVVPNRRGLWSRMDKTPFGHGRPYTMKQMRNLLHDADFVVDRHTRALYFLPSHNRLLQLLTPVLERLGRSALPKFGGVLVIEASKRLYSVTAIPVAQTKQSLWNPEPIGAG